MSTCNTKQFLAMLLLHKLYFILPYLFSYKFPNVKQNPLSYSPHFPLSLLFLSHFYFSHPITCTFSKSICILEETLLHLSFLVNLKHPSKSYSFKHLSSFCYSFNDISFYQVFKNLYLQFCYTLKLYFFLSPILTIPSILKCHSLTFSLPFQQLLYLCFQLNTV